MVATKNSNADFLHLQGRKIVTIPPANAISHLTIVAIGQQNIFISSSKIKQTAATPQTATALAINVFFCY